MERFKNVEQTPTPTPTEKMTKLLNEMKAKGNFHLDEGETTEDVIARCELLERVLNKLEQIAPQIISTYRSILEEHSITEEQTGKLSWVVVGGRVHGESTLKTWSDIDTIITAEKPFLRGRNLFLTEEERQDLPEIVERDVSLKVRRELVTKFLSEIIPNLGEMVEADLGEEGVLEIKGFGDQRNQDVKDGLVIFTEV